MKTNELITKIRSVMHMVAPPARELLEQAADRLELMLAEFTTIREDGLCAVCVFDDIAPPNCHDSCCFEWRGATDTNVGGKEVEA